MKKKFLIGMILSVPVIYFFFFLLSKEKEKIDWSEAQKRGTIEVYKEFLKLHPRSSHAPEVDWFYFRKAADKNTIRAYEDYLEAFPRGISRDKARLQIDELRFKEVDDRKTILGYEDFLRRYPRGEKSALVESRLQTILEGRQPAWKDVKTAKILLHVSFPEGVRLPFLEVAKRILECSGIAVIEADRESADAVLTIEANGRTWGTPVGGYEKIIYRDASLNGAVALKNINGRESKKSFQSQKNPEEWLTYLKGSKEKPADAPFLEIFGRAFPLCLLELMRDLFGDSVLVFSLGGDFYVPEKAAIGRGAAQILSTIRIPRTTGLLIEYWEHLDRDGKANAAYALGNMKDPRIFDLLTGSLKYGGDNLKKNILIALGKIGDPRAVGFLLPLLQEKDDAIREIAIDALGAIGDDRAIESLINSLRSEGSDRIAAAKALQRITSQKLGPEHDAWAGWWDINKEKYLNRR